MTKFESTSTEISTCLLNERAALRAFIAILEKEQQALLDSDSDQLLLLAELKSQAANQITRLTAARRQLLNFDQIDTANWLQVYTPDLLPLWSELVELGKSAHQNNQINGEVIQLKLRSNTLALNALLNAGKASHNLYGRNGQTSVNIAGRILGNG